MVRKTQFFGASAKDLSNSQTTRRADMCVLRPKLDFDEMQRNTSIRYTIAHELSSQLLRTSTVWRDLLLLEATSVVAKTGAKTAVTWPRSVPARKTIGSIMFWAKRQQQHNKTVLL
jgi:hypothetical protein